MRAKTVARVCLLSSILIWVTLPSGFVDTDNFAIGVAPSTLVINQNKAGLTSITQSTYTINGTEYSAAELGEFSGKLTFDSLAPYLSGGWGNPLGKNVHGVFVCDLGVVFQGEPELSLKANGPAASAPDFQFDLKQARPNLAVNLDVYKYYPVVSVSASYQF